MWSHVIEQLVYLTSPFGFTSRAENLELDGAVNGRLRVCMCDARMGRDNEGWWLDKRSGCDAIRPWHPTRRSET